MVSWLPASSELELTDLSTTFTFSEKVDVLEAIDPSHYYLSGPAARHLNIASIESLGDSRSFKLHFSGTLHPWALNIGVSHISDISSNKNIMTSVQTITFKVLKPISIVQTTKARVGSTTSLITESTQTVKYITSFSPDIIKVREDGSLRAIKEGLAEVQVEDELGNTSSQFITVGPAIENNINYQLPAYTSSLSYRLISFPYYLDDEPELNLTSLLKKHLGTMSDTNYLVWGYDSANNKYIQLGEGIAVSPGQAYWVASLHVLDRHLGEPGPQIDEIVPVNLTAGWNLIGNPYNQTISTQDISLQTEAGLTAVSSKEQNTLGHHFWYFEEGMVEYTSLSQLAIGQGAWIWCGVESGTARIVFAPNTQLNKASARNIGTYASEIELSNEPWPPEPPQNVGHNANQIEAPQSVAGGGGGCLLKM